MFQPGSIRRIQVKNFVTYSYAEFYPGPHLNMIIGPNGTGKSTMVAAIILGLGGSPKTVGRGTKISEYVKHGCDNATTDIHLQGNSDNSFLRITRNFDINERNVWSINGVKKSSKEVLEVINTYNIQVNNLCQFLPQDRVQDFAKMNKQELLKATQLALCREDLIEKQQKLIDSKDKYAGISTSLEKNEQKLVQAKESNARLEVKVESFNKKKKYLDNIQDIERKIAWLRFEQLKEEVDEVKKDKIEATQAYEKYKALGKPMEDEINKAKNNSKVLTNIHSNLMKTKWDTENRLEAKYDRLDLYKQSIQSVDQEMNVKLDEFSERESEINSTMEKIKVLENNLKKLMEKYQNDQEVHHKLKQISSEINLMSSKERKAEQEKDQVLFKKRNNQAELNMLHNELKNLEDVKSQRFQKLCKLNRGVYDAVLWLRNNKHLFKGEVCEPMMLEINILDARNAIFLENIISKRDRLAFTCEKKEDMNLLIHCLRNQQNLSVNVLHSNRDIDMSNYQPNIPIEQLKKFGFYAYIDSLLTAPKLIMNYLYKSYRIHDIPIGNTKVDQYFENVPNSIRLFFSERTRYAVKFSAYTGAKITSQNVIAPNHTLSISVDIVRLENLKGEIQHKEELYANIDNEIKNYDNEILNCRSRITELQAEQKVITDLKQHIQAVGSRYSAMKKKIEKLQQANTDRDSVKEEAAQKIKGIVKEMVLFQKEILSTFISCKELSIKSAISFKKLEASRNKASYLEQKFRDTKRQCDEAEEVLNAVKEKYCNIVGQGKAALQKAKQLSKGFTPDDEGFIEFKQKFDKLSRDVKALQQEKDQILLKIDCLKIADDGELEEYEQREELIRTLEREIDENNNELNKMKSQMEKIEEDWLLPLGNLINEINIKFSNAFNRMKCSGELAIWTGDNVTDYSQYGLSVKVSYRNGEPLQELNSTTQSGGERAVATAAFMLSLQELTPVPFRCVDEINQGMDNNNERRIFDLLLDCTTQENTSQYFLITPKLVPNLKYSKNMAVHIVHNGPFVTPDRKWHMSKLCNPQGVKVNS